MNEDADFNCPLCFEYLVQPRKLVCGHRFCAQCLVKSYVKIKDQTCFSHTCNVCDVWGTFVERDDEFQLQVEQRFPTEYNQRLGEMIQNNLFFMEPQDDMGKDHKFVIANLKELMNIHTTHGGKKGKKKKAAKKKK